MQPLPGGAAADQFSQGDTKEAWISLAGDATLLVGGLGKALQVGRKAGAILKAGQALEKSAVASNFIVKLGNKLVNLPGGLAKSVVALGKLRETSLIGTPFTIPTALDNTDLPLAELRRRSNITERAKTAGDSPDFSARIRQGLTETEGK